MFPIWESLEAVAAINAVISPSADPVNVLIATIAAALTVPAALPDVMSNANQALVAVIDPDISAAI